MLCHRSVRKPMMAVCNAEEKQIVTSNRQKPFMPKQVSPICNAAKDFHKVQQPEKMRQTLTLGQADLLLPLKTTEHSVMWYSFAHFWSSKHIEATETQNTLLFDGTWSLSFRSCLERRREEHMTIRNSLRLLGRPLDFLFGFFIRFDSAALLVGHAVRNRRKRRGILFITTRE